MLLAMASDVCYHQIRYQDTTNKKFGSDSVIQKVDEYLDDAVL